MKLDINKIRKNMIYKYLDFSIIMIILSLLIAFIFLFAGISKIIFLKDFIIIIHYLENFKYLPANLLFIFGLFLGSLEIFTGIIILTKNYRSLGAMLASILLSCFVFFIIFALASGRNIQCGCFGPFSKNISFKLLIQDILLLIFSLTIYIDYSQKKP